MKIQKLTPRMGVLPIVQECPRCLNSDRQNWFARRREALAMVTGLRLSSFFELRLGILVARESLAKDNLFHVEFSSPWTSLVSQASLSESQKCWIFGTAKPPLFPGSSAISWETITFFWALPFQMILLIILCKFSILVGLGLGITWIM